MRFLRRWKENLRLACLDADRLTEEFGHAAYEVAWTLAREVRSGTLIDSRPQGHWERVQWVIAHRNFRKAWKRR